MWPRRYTGALGEIKNSSVPDGSNMYISLDGGVSGEIFDAVTRALKVSFGTNTVFEPLGTITSDNGRLDITGLLPDNSGITINKATYAFSDITKGSYKSCTHNAAFAEDTDNRMKLNISCTVDGMIVHGDIDVALTFERLPRLVVQQRRQQGQVSAHGRAGGQVAGQL